MPDPTPERLTELRRIAEAATPGPWVLDTDYFKTCPQHGAEINESSEDGRDWTHFRCGCERDQYVPDTCPWCGAERENGPWYRFVTYRCRSWITEGGVVHRSVICLRAQIKTLLDRIEALERQVHLANNLALSAEQLVKAWEANEGDLTLYLDDLRHDLMDYYARYGAGDSETPSDEQPGAVIALTQDDCLILMWGLVDPDEYVCTGDGKTIPPSEDTPEMRQTRERYRRLMDRIIDVGAGLTGGANDA